MKNILLAAALMLPLSAAPALAEAWTVNPAQSSLGFAVKQADGQVAGTFQNWEADIDFDPAHPESAAISARIDTSSAQTGNAQYDDMLTQPDYFNANTVTTATFTTTKVTAVDEDTYQAEGSLEIKGISQPVTLDFTLEIDGDTAHAKGIATLSRSAFDMGASVAPSTLADAVTVTLDLIAAR